MRTRTLAITSVAACTALLGIGGTAVAAGSSPAPSSSAKHHTGDGAKSLCKRAPKIDKRLTKALHRLQGNAEVRGSVARLEKRVANAKAAGHNEVETFLSHKLAHRKSMIPTLQQRQKDLAKVASWCRTQHSTTSS
ncbi:hypothetical protein ACFVZM_24390 [Streptomyces sioyaensis]|uniref:hypothetical protein n=1 Tax=Streptomyces sioyaensis TaxID=67364 RepID=UPI0036A21FA2